MKHRISAILLALVLLLSACEGQKPQDDQAESSKAESGKVTEGGHAQQLAMVTPPEAVYYPTEVEYNKDGHLDYDAYEKAMQNWADVWAERREGTENNLRDLDAYYRTATPVFLKSALSNQKNAVCSPLNIYMAFAMLAETTDGETRQQILDFLGTTDTVKLQTTVANLWRSNYEEDDVLTCILANSVWLAEDREYKQALLDRLAEDYYADAFSGTMGSSEYNKMIQDWLNDRTQGLLEDAAKGIELDPQTVLALASTLYYKASWVEGFSTGATTQEPFYGVDGEETVDMMHRTKYYAYYEDEDFRAAALPLKLSGNMWVFLPAEGQDPESLLDNQAVWDLLCGKSESQIQYPRLAVSMPRFDVNAKMSLIDGLCELGVTNVMDAGKSDFSPLCDDHEGLVLSEATHAARVMADEDGVIGAAFTVLAVKATAAFVEEEPIPFVVDRPFIFCVTAEDGSLLFMGVVNTVQGS